MNVLTKIERYLRRSGQKPTRFGRNVCDRAIIKIIEDPGFHGIFRDNMGHQPQKTAIPKRAPSGIEFLPDSQSISP